MAITRAQIARELYIKGGVVNPDGRRGFGGGADFGQVGTDGKQGGKGSNPGLSGPSKGGYQGGPKGGYGDAGSDNKPSKEVIKEQKEKYEKQFFDKGEVPPLGSRPTSLKTKIDQRNKQKRLNYINTLIANRRNKINKGLIDYQDEFGQFQGLTDFDELEDYIGKVQSVQDLVDQGFYKSDGKFSKGAIPDFSVKTGIPTADFFSGIFGGPITSDRLNELMTEMDTLKGLKTTDGLESTNFNELMETYQPNRFKLENPEPGGNDNNQQQTDPCLGPNPPAYCAVNNDPADPATPSRNLGGLAPRFAGSIFDFTGLADGGRAGAMDGGRMMMMANQEEDDPTGGIMDLESGRQMYFLGKLVKKATRAVKKVVKSPIGKAALMYGLGSLGASALGKYQAGAGAGGSGFFSKAGRFLLGTKGVDEDGGTMGLLGKLGLTGGFGGFKPTLKGGITLGLGIPALMDLFGKKEEDEGFDIDEYYRTAGLGGQKGIDAIRLAGIDGLANRFKVADGGRINYAEGSEEPVAKKTMPLIDMDGKEMDLREDGGFVPLGRMERADDVPARLSKNEFVFTADAVRNAGEGDIDKGAEVMYNMMKNLESGGEVSEESQGLDGAREMFKTSQRLEEVL